MLIKGNLSHNKRLNCIKIFHFEIILNNFFLHIQFRINHKKSINHNHRKLIFLMRIFNAHKNILFSIQGNINNVSFILNNQDISVPFSH